MNDTLLLTGGWAYTATYHPPAGLPDPDLISTWMTSDSTRDRGRYRSSQTE